MKLKLTIITLILLLLLSNGYWLYSATDSGVTRAYHEDVRREFANRITTLSKFADVLLRDMPGDSLQKMMNTVFGKENVFEKDNGIHAPWISLGIDEKGNFQNVIVDENVTAWTERGTVK